MVPTLQVADILKEDRTVFLLESEILQGKMFTCRHDDASKNLPACVGGGEVFCQVPELIQNQACHSVR